MRGDMMPLIDRSSLERHRRLAFAPKRSRFIDARHTPFRADSRTYKMSHYFRRGD